MTRRVEASGGPRLEWAGFVVLTCLRTACWTPAAGANTAGDAGDASAASMPVTLMLRICSIWLHVYGLFSFAWGLSSDDLTNLEEGQSAASSRARRRRRGNTHHRQLPSVWATF